MGVRKLAVSEMVVNPAEEEFMQAPEISDMVSVGQEPFALNSVMLPLAIGDVPAADNLK